MRAGSVCKPLKKIQSIVIIITLLLVMPLQAALEDPTRPPATTITSKPSDKTQRPRWILTSTLISTQRRAAVINNKVVSRGEHINGAKIISIQPSAVQLRIGRRDITLMMLKKNIKSLSRAASLRQGK